LALGAVASPAAAQDRPQRACEAIEQRINALAAFTSTFCTPAGGQRPGTYSFFLVSQATVFGNEELKKLWVVVAVAAAGSVLNQDPSLPADRITLADSQTLARERTSFALPAASARRLQDRLRRGEIDADAMYAAVLKELRPERPGKGPGR
jgi:hypothetical protein